MWCTVCVIFGLLTDFNNFPVSEMGDTEVYENEVVCTGNHRLIQDVLSWVECDSEGDVKVIVNFDGYDTTYLYEEGVKLYEESVLEDTD